MSWFRLYLLVALLPATALAGCSMSDDDDAAVTLDEADSGQPLTLAVGQRVTLNLESNISTGFSWALADSARGAIARDGAPTYTDEGGSAGSSGVETWRFRAARAGSGTLRLVYRQPFNPGDAPAQTFSAPVTVR